MKLALKFLQFVGACGHRRCRLPRKPPPRSCGGTRCRAQLGKQLEKLAADFNASQSDYRIVPAYKGNYTETVTAAIFAFRSRSQPAIVQVNEIATATMMAAKGAIYPVFELMRDQSEPFSPAAYLPAVTGYYSDVAGNMLSFPFNVSTPILYYNKDVCSAPPVSIRRWRRRPGPRSAPRPSGCARRARPAGFTTSWPSWINVENFSAFHNLPLATRANGFGGLDAELDLQQSAGGAPHRAACGMAGHESLRLQRPRTIGRAALPERRVRDLHRLVGDARRHHGQFEVRGRLRHDPVLARNCRRAAKQHHRRRHAVGAARPAARRIHRRRPVLRLSVEAGSSGRLAPEHRLSADHPRRLRSHPRAGLLRSQSRARRFRSSRSH